ncbi:hypothetical protein [Brachybacterium sacelli]|uniref:Abortive infection protein n=1 Tax=Brachybacterium sacelli TaxID=173364 RepID=A0ABS4WVW2_9MICO|nr:hypothetical protein [Brachybacterium sacelli]MBP2380346.1 hypothetical protein [Brachybacterium sacelli]
MLAVRGVSYLVDDVDSALLRRDVDVIADELFCNAVMIIGRDRDQLLEAAGHTLRRGLSVHLRPDATDLDLTGMLDQLAAVAQDAQRMRAEHPDQVVLVVGSEFSHSVSGIVPAPRSFLRLALILKAHRLLRRRIDARLPRMLERAAATARAHFAGPVTYSAASWENVDWSLFDLVGVSLYRAAGNHADYPARVAALVRDHGRPFVVTEFGCGAFTGAQDRGAGSFQIVNWFSEPPRIRGDHPRDEAVQARYLSELLDLYDGAGVHGGFVFTYAMPDFPRHDDPAQDLDKAGFALVVTEGDMLHRKQAFHVVADRYRRALGAAE